MSTEEKNTIVKSNHSKLYLYSSTIGTPSPAPARYSIRFFISGWWFFIMVILWSYAGTLTSFMTYPGRRPAIDTVKKLRHALVSQSIQYGTLKGTSYENFLKVNYIILLSIIY